MKNQVINPLNAKSIKKFMKISGINVLRCSQNGFGVLVTVSNDKKNIENATKFFLEYGLSRKSEYAIPAVISSSEKYADFGTVYSISYK